MPKINNLHLMVEINLIMNGLTMLVNKKFQIGLLIGWQLNCQPVRSKKIQLNNMDFDMYISLLSRLYGPTV